MLGSVNDTHVEFQAILFALQHGIHGFLHHHACLPGSEATSQDRAEVQAGRRRTFRGPSLHEFRDGLCIATQGESCGSCQNLSHTLLLVQIPARGRHCARLLTASPGRQLRHVGSFDRLDHQAQGCT